MNNYLLDKEFLRKLDLQRLKEKYVKIISLSFNEKELEEIEGVVTTGSINIDGNSTVRRTCSLSLIVKDNTSNSTINASYWTINHKFKVYIGLKNDINESYPNIIWFPQGVYTLSSFSQSINNNQNIINISGKDKMCILNGEVGGAIPSLSWDFGTIDEIQEDGSIINTSLPIKQIVRDLVHHYAQEPYENIIINDLDETAVELLNYKGTSPLYLIINNESQTVENITLDGTMNFNGYQLDNNDTSKTAINYDLRFILDGGDTAATIIEDENNSSIHYTIGKITNGETVGYRSTSLTYAGDLIGTVGESATSILDKIVKMLGNYEYFYNLDGQFIFQRKKTYVSTSFNNLFTDSDDNVVYAIDNSSVDEVTYKFDGDQLLTSFQNTPNLQNLANDYSLWGTRNTTNGDVSVHLRYAIDDKPDYYKAFNGQTYITTVYENKTKETKIEELTTEFIKEVNEFTPTYGTITGLQAPTRNADGSWTEGWWDIRDWYQYYKLLTREAPHKTMKWYSYNSIKGCVPLSDLQTLKSNGYSVPTNSSSYVWLIIVNPTTKSVNIQHGSGNPNSSYKSTSTLYESYTYEELPKINPGSLSYQSGYYTTYRYINGTYVYGTQFDTDYLVPIIIKSETDFDLYHSWGIKFCYYDNDNNLQEATNYIAGINYYTSNYFTFKVLENEKSVTAKYIYPYAGCNDMHTYLSFLKDDVEADGNLVYFYHPEFPGVTSYRELVEKEIELEYTENYTICDWREIIYQMALDYYKHGQEDDFAYNVTINNGQDEDGNWLYKNGLTGYEKYYTDLEGFWRQLYCPLDEYYTETISASDYADTDHATYNLVGSATSIMWAPNVFYKYNETTKLYSIDTTENWDDVKNDGNRYIASAYYSIPTDSNGKTTITESTWASSKYYVKSYLSAGFLTEAQFKSKFSNPNGVKEDYYILQADGTYTNVNITINDDNSITTSSLTWSSGTQYYYYIYVLDGSNKYDSTKTYYSRTVQYTTCSFNGLTWKSGKYYIRTSEKDSTTGIVNYTYSLDNSSNYNYGNNYYNITNHWYYLREFNSSTNKYEYNLASGPYDAGLCYWILNTETNKEYYDGTWYKNLTNNPDTINFWFDFLDTDAEMSKYSVRSYGDRPKNVNEDEIKAIYFRETPKVIFWDPKSEELNEIQGRYTGYAYMQYQPYLDSLFTTSSQGKSANDVLEDYLYNYSYCVESVTLQAIPVYYLEPNTRISVQDNISGKNGQYIMTKITIPLAYNGTMSITATKVPEVV